MFDLPIHPAVVHVPLGIAFVLPLLVGALLIATRAGWLHHRAWWTAALLQAVAVAAAVFALRTGEADEERVEHVVPEAAIEAHEHRAETFVWASGALLLGLVAVGAAGRSPWAELLGAAATAGAVGTAALALSVGHAGGELVHRYGATSTAPSASTLSVDLEDEDD